MNYRKTPAVRGKVPANKKTPKIFCSTPVVTVLLCFVAAGIFAASSLKPSVYVDVEKCNIALCLSIAFAKYASFISLCFLCIRYKFCVAVLLTYVACATVIVSFFSYALVTVQPLMLLAAVVPNMIYLFTVAYLTSVLFVDFCEKANVQFDSNGDIITKSDVFVSHCLGALRIMAVGILMEGVVAPLVI